MKRMCWYGSVLMFNRIACLTHKLEVTASEDRVAEIILNIVVCLVLSVVRTWVTGRM
jgi:hypothetical protein